MKKLIILLMLAVSLPSFAQDYNVEAIIFKRNISPDSTGEAWPQDLKAIDYSQSASYKDSTAMLASGAQLLSSDHYQLNKAYQALEDHAGFEPLLHVAWSQNNQDTPVIHIDSGQDFTAQFGEKSVNMLESTKKINELEGTLKLSGQDELSFESHLDLKIPAKVTSFKQSTPSINSNTDNVDEPVVQTGKLAPIEAEEISEVLKTYRLNEQRTVVTDEVNYIDNPLFGILLKITRI